jgi:catechol 2,3-dioxygenase-like lactoylglutathione lyase family enzyme
MILMSSHEPVTVLRRSDLLRLVVPSLTESLHFWTAALGFVVIRKDQATPDNTLSSDPALTAGVELQAKGYRVLLVERAEKSVQPSKPVTSAPIALSFQVSNLAAHLMRIRKAGYMPSETRIVTLGPREGWQTATVSGPDRVVVELMQPG